MKRYARDAAHWVIRREAQGIAELMQSLVAEFTTLADAESLPDLMLFPAALSLAASGKNIYGVLPPSDDDLAQIESLLMRDEIIPGREMAIYWIEYVIRHGSTKHLQLAGKDMPFYQRYLLDVAFFLVLIVVISLIIAYKLASFLLCCCKGRTKKIKTN